MEAKGNVAVSAVLLLLEVRFHDLAIESSGIAEVWTTYELFYSHSLF